jgi:hypothetical protein
LRRDIDAARRGRGPRRWPSAYAAWLAPGGPATLAEPSAFAPSTTLALVAAHERAGDLPDWSAFAARVAGSACRHRRARQRVQVMTMPRRRAPSSTGDPAGPARGRAQ